MAMMREIMGCFTRSNRGEEKGYSGRESVMMLLNIFSKCAGKHTERVFPITHKRKKHKLHPTCARKHANEKNGNSKKKKIQIHHKQRHAFILTHTVYVAVSNCHIYWYFCKTSR